MSFIVIEKIDKNNDYEEEDNDSNTNRYSLTAIIGFILAIISLFIPGKYAIYLLPASIIISIIAIIRIKRSLKRGKKLAILGLLISLIYLIIYISLTTMNKNSNTETNQEDKKIINTICSMTDKNGNYSFYDEGNYIICKSYNCTIRRGNNIDKFNCITKK